MIASSETFVCGRIGVADKQLYILTACAKCRGIDHTSNKALSCPQPSQFKPVPDSAIFFYFLVLCCFSGPLLRKNDLTRTAKTSPWALEQSTLSQILAMAFISTGTKMSWVELSSCSDPGILKRGLEGKWSKAWARTHSWSNYWSSIRARKLALRNEHMEYLSFSS